MNVDGLKFSKCHTVVALPNADKDGNRMPYVKEGTENYVYFGQIVTVPDGQDPAPHLIDTGFTYKDSGKPVYAKIIPSTGHSLTNMMYATGAYKGFAYLMKDGKYYRARVNKSPVAAVAEVVATAETKDDVAQSQPAAETPAELTTETVNLASMV